MFIIKKLAEYKVAIVPLLILLALSTIRVNDPALLSSFRNQVFDAYQLAVPRKTENKFVSVGTIDEKSLKELGQWPWPRITFSKVISKLREKGAIVVAFDVLFAEQDRFSPNNVANYNTRYGQQKIDPAILSKQFPDGDEIFAKELAASRVVMALAPVKPGVSDLNLTGMRAPVLIKGDGTKMRLPLYQDAIKSLPQFNKAAAGIGSISLEREADGVVRRLPLLSKVGKTFVPALGLEALRLAAGGRGYFLLGDQSGVTGVTIPPRFAFETDAGAALRIRWERFNTDTYFSIADLLNDKVPDQLIKNKIVIIGANATGLYDFKKTPIQANTPGVEIHRQFIETLISGSAPLRQAYFMPLEIFIALVLLAINLFLAIKTKPYLWLSGFIIFVVALPLSSFFSFKNYNVLLDPSFPTFAFILSMTAAFLLKFRDEYKEKMEIKAEFDGYASPAIVKMLTKNRSLVKQGVQKDVTIVFSDLRGFTSLGESFGADVDGFSKLMNRYMDCISQPILNSKGILIKYIGDATMSIHNAPIDDDDHAETAILTALLMIQALREFNIENSGTGLSSLELGLGINSGPAFLGEMGSSLRHSYDAIGDTISTAARIEAQCKEYSLRLLIGEETYQRTKDKFLYLTIDRIFVRGKEDKINIYTIIEDNDGLLSESEFLADKKLHDEMMDLYEKEDFAGTISLCESLKSRFRGQIEPYYGKIIASCREGIKLNSSNKWNEGIHSI